MSDHILIPDVSPDRSWQFRWIAKKCLIGYTNKQYCTIMYIFIQDNYPICRQKSSSMRSRYQKNGIMSRRTCHPLSIRPSIPRPKPVGPADLSAIFPMELIRQEVTTDRHVDIPGEVQDVLRLWRPSPLYRAHRLEKFLKTPAKIYYKWEGVSPAGSHKPNTSVPQAFYNMKEGVERISTETGAGQWGSAIAFATILYDLECT